MGTLRYFLALVVVFAHSPTTLFSKPLNGDGGLAVQSFFLISGFYMSLIFEKYNLRDPNYKSLSKFYLSRLLRIFPLYWIILLISILTYYVFSISSLILHEPIKTFHLLENFRDKFIYVFENLFIFGQGVMRFSFYDLNLKAFVFADYKFEESTAGSGYAVLGQAWTLSLEMTFYLLSPFLLRKSNQIIFGICCVSFLLRYFLTNLDFDNSYNIQTAFFPTELGIFLLGTLSHRLFYSRVSNLLKKTSAIVYYSSIAIIISFIVFPKIPIKWEVQYWFFIFYIFILIPFLFHFFKDSKIDNFIGELSYPVYLIHIFIISLFQFFLSGSSLYVGYYTAILSTLVSIPLVIFIQKPIDNFRHSIVFNRRKESDFNNFQLNLKPLENNS
ncbi:MAG: acyltransferase [Alphaproteobacteria bacterium]|nr:acyltransferase [Alphaproteobacteria bacterium]